MKFKAARWDRKIRNTTFLLSGILIALSAFFFYRSWYDFSYYNWVPGIFPLVILFLAYLYQPIAYILEIDYLEIRQRIKTTIIKREEIVSFEHLIHFNSIDLLGSGRLFGYIGSPQKNENWFVTNRNQIIKIKTKTEIFFISPEEIHEFKNEFQAILNTK